MFDLNLVFCSCSTQIDKHDRNCPNYGKKIGVETLSYRLASRIVEILQQYKKVPIGFISHITDHNLNEVKKIIEELKERKVISIEDGMVSLNGDVAER